MDFKNIARSVAAIAPGIGSAIGGPAGAVIGLGVKTLAGFFGIDAGASDVEQQIESALQQMTPEQAVELKRLDKQFIIDMKKLDVDVFKLEVEDKNSARQMHIATKSHVPAALTFILLAVASFLVYTVFTSAMTGMDKTLVGTVIGYVFSELKQATSFWLGSSKGSQDKNIIASIK